MINVAGAPAACLDAAHVQFSWTEGAAPADSSVTTAKLATGAVTSAKIADGTIVTADLASGSVTSTQILDGTILAGDLAASAVLAPGVEFAAPFFFDPTAVPTTAQSLSVSHPGSGYLVAMASGQINCTAATYVLLGITSTGTGNDGYLYQVPAVGVGVYTMVHKQEVIAVTGAGTTTLNFNLDLSADNCTGFRTINFRAVYVPNRY